MPVIAWHDGSLRFLDQTKLPAREDYVETRDPAVVLHAIGSLAIRGAPLIGIAAAYGLALAALQANASDPSSVPAAFDAWAERLTAVRPTAVNLRWAVDRMKQVVVRHGSDPAEELRQALVQEAIRIHDEDRRMCDAIARHGVALLGSRSRVLTHCNTGALATGGEGTALGVVKLGWKAGKVRMVYVDETRPLLQGARLTSWELRKEDIPQRLITDSTAAALMQQGEVDAVIVGADRIARNGDVANKIGTYGLAVIAAHHGVPFYVAAPSSTVDRETATGSEIPIEERSASELTQWQGHPTAPTGVAAFTPAFDITPASLVTAIVTEHGVLRPPLEAGLAHLPSRAEPAP